MLPPPIARKTLEGKGTRSHSNRHRRIVQGAHSIAPSVSLMTANCEGLHRRNDHDTLFASPVAPDSTARSCSVYVA